MGLADEQAHSSLRFSVGRFTTEEEIDYVTGEVKEAIRKLANEPVSQLTNQLISE